MLLSEIAAKCMREVIMTKPFPDVRGRSMKIVVLRVRYDSVRNASESEIQGCWAENLWMMRSYEVIINNLRIAIFE